VLEHFPDGWIAPVVWRMLREDLDFEIVVATFEHPWTREDIFNVDAHHVLTGFLEGVIECLLVLTSFSYTVGHEALTITDKDEDTTLVHSVK